MAGQDGTLLRPGEKFIVDIDMNRAIALHLMDFYFAGTYAGDKLVTAYLEELEDGKD